MNISHEIEERCKNLKIGYAPMTHSMKKMGDRGRFCHYAHERNIKFEIADPKETYDIVVVTHLGDPTTWSRYNKGNCKIVYDLVDSYLAIPRSNLKGLFRGLAKFISRQSRHLQLDHWKTIQTMCERSDAVICGTEEQKQDILPFCSNTHIILDAQNKLIRSQKKDYSSGTTFNLVWQGLPENIILFNEIADVLNAIKDKYNISLHLITNLSYFKYLNRFKKVHTNDVIQKIFQPTYLYDWNEDLCSKIITSCDLGIIPLSLEDPFIKGKPENKLLLFWMMGMPTIVSATPAYSRVMERADLNMTCRTQQDWHDTLESYIQDECARKVAGEKGLAFTSVEHGKNQILERWDQLFESVLM